MKKYKIILAIRSLEIGGAERQFIELVKNIDLNRYELSIVSNYKGILDHEIKSFNHILMQKNGFWDLTYFIKLYRYIVSYKPDLVYCFMPDMNITMSIIKIFYLFKFKLVWGQFGSEPDFNDYDSIMKKLYKIQKKIEFTVNGVLSDGTQGLEFYKKLGYKLRNSEVIYSGTDINRFIFNDVDRKIFRDRYGLTNHTIAIGICSRLDPMKGYYVLAEAARNILLKYDNIYFFSIGYGDDSIKYKSIKILGDCGNRFIWLDKQSQPEKIFSGWDIYCSTSLYGEGFSNSIIEAMSCSLPVIATKVGEAEHQVGIPELVIEPGNPKVLENALLTLIEGKNYKELGLKSRQRVEHNFSSILMAEKTQLFFNKILNDTHE
jgi:glycosyltransferase involved in cell wall biosynthesis